MVDKKRRKETIAEKNNYQWPIKVLLLQSLACSFSVNSVSFIYCPTVARVQGNAGLDNCTVGIQLVGEPIGGFLEQLNAKCPIGYISQLCLQHK